MKYLICALLYLFSQSALASVAAMKAIKEAESLALVHERLFASNVLVRAIKKSSKDDIKILKEKIFQLANTFYTDKGFQLYLSGKDLVSKQKFVDALDKLTEADDLEKGNAEVLHQLTLSQLQLKKTDLAEASNKRGLQTNPFDTEILKDQVAVKSAQEKWADVVKLSESLMAETSDHNGYLSRARGLAALRLNLLPDSKRYLEMSVARDPDFPDTYYWLANLRGNGDVEKSLKKYVEICKNKAKLYFERDVSICQNSADAEKKLLEKK